MRKLRTYCLGFAPISSPMPAVFRGRMWRTVYVCLPLVPLLTATAISFPQTQQNLKARSAAIPIVPSQNLDFSGGRLPSNFVPIDPDELYRVASKALPIPEKSQFETTAQYQSRVEASAHKVLLRGLKLGDDFAFVLRPSSRAASRRLQKRDDFLNYVFDDFVETEYDADSKQMSVSIPTNNGDVSHDKNSVTAIRLSLTYGEPYVGQTAFGAKRLVRAVKTDTLDLDWTTDLDGKNWLPDGLSLTVEPDEARALSGDVEVIMIGRLRAPFTSHWVGGTEASLEQIEPIDITLLHRVLYISLDRVIIANGRTGAILKQTSRQEVIEKNQAELEKHRAEFPLAVEFRGEDVPFTDARCEHFPLDFFSMDYSVDGGEENHVTVRGPLQIEARKYVDVRIEYCYIPRVRALVNGRPYKLSCDYQEQYIADDSKCARIQIEPQQSAPSN